MLTSERRPLFDKNRIRGIKGLPFSFNVSAPKKIIFKINQVQNGYNCFNFVLEIILDRSLYLNTMAVLHRVNNGHMLYCWYWQKPEANNHSTSCLFNAV